MRCIIALVFCCLLSVPSAFASTGMPWPHEGSDLAPDPRITFGRLDNGVRLAVFPSGNPKGAVSLRLYVAAGSLHENSAELGLAHFVEHLAFNGTTHFPAGKLVEFLQRQGMGFGADVNAFTSYSSTIYKLELNNNNSGNLREALQILRDYADGILFDPAAVEQERGIIRAEGRVRDTMAMRNEIEQTRILYPVSLLVERLPIGSPEIIEHATPAALQAFYHAWYQPERMTLVVTGDITASEVQGEIRRAFDDLKSSAPPRPEPVLAPVKANEKFLVNIHRDPGMLGTSLTLENIRNNTPHAFGSKDFINRLYLDAAYHSIAQRTDRLAARKDSPEGGFSMKTAAVEQVYLRSHFECGTSINQWKAALRDLTLELRRAQSQGFTAAEIARGRLGLESWFKEAITTKKSKTSSELADELTASFANNEIVMSPESQWSFVSAALPNLTTETCQAALNEAWNNGRKAILVTSNASFTATPSDVAEVHDQGLTIPLGAPDDQATAHFGYTNFGLPGEVAAKTQLSGSDSWEITFRNGVRLHFKQTAFETNSVQVSIRFGIGRLNEPVDKPGLGMLAMGQLFGGLGKHTLNELGQILTGTHGSVVFNVGTDGFLFTTTSTPENTLLFTQLLTAFIVDPAFREESRSQTNATLASSYQQFWDGPQGVINELIGPQLAGGDSRVGMPRRTSLDAYSLTDFKNWFMPQVKFAPMEVIMVGDISLEAAVQVVAQTVGALPALLPTPDLEKYRTVPFPKKPFDFTWTVEGTKSESGFVQLYWPLPKHVSGAEQLRLALMMDILEDRLRISIRQTMGKTYSPSTGVEMHRDFHNYGWLTCQVEANPADLLRVQKAVQEQVARLAKGGISADELQRVQQVQLAARERSQQTNSYWRSALDEGARYPESAEMRDHGTEILRSATLPEINRMARDYFRPNQASIFRIIPKAAVKK